MKLLQLRYLREIQRHGYNISVTAEKLYTSQPGISKQVRLLEDEIGVNIFERQGKHLLGPTEVGKQIIQEADKMLDIEDRIKAIAASVTSANQGRLNIHTTNSIANFLLPESIRFMINKYPKVSVHLSTIDSDYYKSGSTLPMGPHDLSIIARDIEDLADLVMLPAYKWSLSLILPSDHPLASAETITLEQLAQEKLISYDLMSSGRMSLDKAFRAKGLEPTYIITAMDVGTIKEFVSAGVGVGIIATISTHDLSSDITVRSLEGLIPDSYAWFCYKKDIHIHKYMYDFIEKFSPHLTRKVIEDTTKMSKDERIKWFDEHVSLKHIDKE